MSKRSGLIWVSGVQWIPNGRIAFVSGVVMRPTSVSEITGRRCGRGKGSRHWFLVGSDSGPLACPRVEPPTPRIRVSEEGEPRSESQAEAWGVGEWHGRSGRSDRTGEACWTGRSGMAIVFQEAPACPCGACVVSWRGSPRVSTVAHHSVDPSATPVRPQRGSRSTATTPVDLPGVHPSLLAESRARPTSFGSSHLNLQSMRPAAPTFWIHRHTQDRMPWLGSLLLQSGTAQTLPVTAANGLEGASLPVEVEFASVWIRSGNGVDARP